MADLASVVQVLLDRFRRHNKYPQDCIKVLDHGFVRLVDHMGSDSEICDAARVSYISNKELNTVDEVKDETLIRYLLRRRHTSPFEMVEFKFHCKMPIFIARQWIRHRTANVNEMSGRYSEMPAECYVPELEHITGQSKDNKQGGTDEILPGAAQHRFDLYTEQRNAHHAYSLKIKSGMRKELARINLPLSQYTEWYWKIDLHNLFHFLRLRMDSHAQQEFQDYANAIYDLILPIVPACCKAFDDYILNSVTLSGKEVRAFSEYIDLIYNSVPGTQTFEESFHEYAKRHFRNKRERDEFVEKAKLLGPVKWRKGYL